MSSHPVGGRDPEELLHAEAYTEEELSDLFGIGVDVIRRAAREGRLRARIVNHELISIRRDDALEWIRSRG
jgi:predicted nucleotidyltransferase